jgi:hypothetical protein
MLLSKSLKSVFLEKVYNRGYSFEQISACIISDDNNIITADITHPAYPRPQNFTHKEFLDFIQEKTKNKDISTPNTDEEFIHGVGTELKTILKIIGITSTPNCSCNAKAKLMNQNGIQWCKDNIDTIVVWLKEEATRRNLPFFTYAAKKLVKLAISRAEHAKTG